MPDGLELGKTDSKGMYDEVQKNYVVRVEKWIETVNDLQRQLPSPSTDKQKAIPISTYQPSIDGVRNQLTNLSGSMSASKRDLDHVTEVFNLRKTRAEVLKTTMESWPPNSYLERLTYISTALFPAGGVPPALAGGWNWVSGTVSAVMWVLGAILLWLSLTEVRKTDRCKMAFFGKEFDIDLQGHLPSISSHPSNGNPAPAMLTKWTTLLSFSGALSISGIVFTTSLALEEGSLRSFAGWTLGFVMIAAGFGLMGYIWYNIKRQAANAKGIEGV